jgi:hypothetical protein
MVCLNTGFYCGTSSDTESRIVTLIILQVDSAFYDTARCNEANNIPQKTETEDRIMDPFVKVSRPQVAVPRGRRVCCLSRRVGILPSQVADKAYLPPPTWTSSSPSPMNARAQSNWMMMTTKRTKMPKNDVPEMYVRSPGRNVH